MLPGIDDGSKNTDMSLEMIRRSVDQGVQGIVFTPHFYADMNSPETFLKNRQNSLEHLKARLGELDQVPVFCTGAEVHFFRGMSRFPGLDSLYLPADVDLFPVVALGEVDLISCRVIKLSPCDDK